MADRNNVHPMVSQQPGGGVLGGLGGGGGGGMDREYLDARIDAVRAQNDASFARVEAKIDAIQPGASWQQIAGLIFVGITGAFGILSYASDRFDSGVASMGAIEEAIDVQRETNQFQDERLDRIIEALEKQNADPQGSPKGQD